MNHTHFRFSSNEPGVVVAFEFIKGFTSHKFRLDTSNLVQQPEPVQKPAYPLGKVPINSKKLDNIKQLLAGLALVVVGIMYKLNIKEVTGILPGDFGLAPILSIIIGAIVFVTAFLGCCGAVKESTCMLTTYAIILLTIFIIQVAIGVYVFLQIKNTNDFRAKIRQNVQTTFDQRFKNAEANETMQVTQKYLQCCGVDGPEDYGGSPIPLSCCQNSERQCPSLNNDVFHEGCAVKLFNVLQNSSQVIGGVAIGIAAIEIIGAIFGLCLASSIRNHYRRHIYA
ncbi:hypothetical protein NQ314_002427 [Rhamnusium bicolor]|uniref:Tetraspanin n=1 Tax=Rhamnusium bicolor TaxID=1586634 RepID=A0AAV8ZPB8_9CUCU|nr:hypothetical protein NQ314_002427 [Rhamnusium bicolor]